MRAVVFHEHGSTDLLRVEEIAEPEAGKGDAIIEVRATSINGFDPQIVAGSTSLATPFPMIPCGDYAGRIVAFGPDTDPGKWQIGDRVAPFPMVPGEGMTGETRLGAACERVRMPIGNLIAVPQGVSDAQAASLPIAYGTARRMLVERGKVKKGERVLVMGASGGVGVACLQLGLQLGAEMIAVASAAWKLEKLRRIGAHHTIDSSAVDVVAQVHALFGKPRLGARERRGVDVVVNFVGGPSWVDGLRCLSPQGRMLTCGASAGFSPPTDIRYIWTYEQSIIGSNGWTPADQEALLAQVAAGELAPVIHAERPLEQTAASIQELADRQVVGKIIIEP